MIGDRLRRSHQNGDAMVGGLLQEATATLRTMLGLTRHGRTREQIRDTVELYQLMGDDEDLADSRRDLAKVVGIHSKRLVANASSERRSWNWASMVVSWIVACFLGFLCWWVLTTWEGWFPSLAAIVLGFLAVLFVIAGVGVLLQPEKNEA
ncbi:MAG: hypothetical protein KDA97_00260 [Acidimicrobiales bacterium]|nr:hypothetical protein [Phycisphaerales bacterium]MCB0969942.1 hypothetical protein [Acidimicrobiales bacterium]